MKEKKTVEKALVRETQATGIVYSGKRPGAIMQRNIIGGVHLQGLCYVCLYFCSFCLSSKKLVCVYCSIHSTSLFFSAVL